LFINTIIIKNLPLFEPEKTVKNTSVSGSKPGEMEDDSGQIVMGQIPQPGRRIWARVLSNPRLLS
jgi:hypothetical protein